MITGIFFSRVRGQILLYDSFMTVMEESSYLTAAEYEGENIGWKAEKDLDYY